MAGTDPHIASTDAEHLFLEKQSRYRGRAKIKLHDLSFEGTEVHGGRSLDQKNVRRLVNIFKTEGCHRLEPEHFVPVLISQARLDEALNESGLNQDELYDSVRIPPLLTLRHSASLTCLHGQHRVEAARRHLAPIDSWWVVELFADDLADAAILQLRSEGTNSRAFSDGDIYRHFRSFQRSHDDLQAQKWLARLSDRKRVDIVLLASKMTTLRDTLDTLLPFVGLWGDVQLGTLHRILSLRCEEELCSYLERVHDMWASVMPLGSEARLNVETVHHLQLLAPKYSREDYERIVDDMQNGRLFPAIQDATQRAEIQTRLLSIQGRILSLYTFLEDTKYLEPCAQILRCYLHKSRTSTREGFRQIYRSAETVAIQVAEHTTLSISVSDDVGFEIAYRQIWLFAMRHFPEMTATNPRKDAHKPTPVVELRQDLYTQLARLARDSGFDIPESNTSQQRETLAQMIYKLINRVRPHDLYETDQSMLDSHIQEISRIVESIPPRDTITGRPSLTSHIRGEPLSHRCGRPFERSHRLDCDYLFLQNICNTTRVESDAHISSFAIKRDIFLSFFTPSSAVTNTCESLLQDSHTASALNRVEDTAESDRLPGGRLEASTTALESRANEEQARSPAESPQIATVPSLEASGVLPRDQYGPFQLQDQTLPLLGDGRILYITEFQCFYRFNTTEALEGTIWRLCQEEFFIGIFHQTGFQAVLPRDLYSRPERLLVANKKFYNGRQSALPTTTLQEIHSLLQTYQTETDPEQALSSWPFRQQTAAIHQDV